MKTTEQSWSLTPQDRAFLDAIVADPCDLTARLVYADWLADQGRDAEAGWLRQERVKPHKSFLLRGGLRNAFPRTQFFRVVLHESAMTPLALYHQATSSAVLQARYGCIEGIFCRQSRFLLVAELLFRLHPVVRVVLAEMRPEEAYWSTGSGDPLTGPVWYWAHSSGKLGRFLESHILAEPLFSRLPCTSGAQLRRIEDGWTMRPVVWYRSEEEAFSALNTACVSLGRQWAGLSPLKAHVG